MAPEIHPTCITAFFAIQALPIAAEKAFSAIAPPYKQGGGGRRRVGGVWGRLWTAAWVLGTGRWIVEGWMRMGLVGMAGECLPFLFFFFTLARRVADAFP